MDDALAKARGGDMAAFSALVTAHQRNVFSVALRMLGSASLAEDIAQDVFMQLHAHLPSIQSASHLSFWLRRVTANKAIDHLRRSSVFEVTSLEGEAAQIGAEDLGDPVLQKRLRSMLLQLTPAARAVMTLRYQEDLDPLEIARILDMSVNTVKSHLKRSLDSLRQSFEGHAI